MKVLALLTTALLAASSASAYRIEVHSANDYKGTKKVYTSNGGHTPGYNIKSWKWASAYGDECCVIFCKGRDEKGRFCGPARNAKSTAGANVVRTGCGAMVLSCP